MVACAILVAETLRTSEMNPISIAMIETPWKIENVNGESNLFVVFLNL